MAAQVPAQGAGSATPLAQQFANHYFTQFNANKANLMQLYNDQTEYTFEKQTVRGKAAIQQKLVSIQRAQAVPKDVVGHLIMSQGGQNMYLVQAQGDFKVDPAQNALKFVESFILIQNPQGQFYIKHDVLKLVYG